MTTPPTTLTNSHVNVGFIILRHVNSDETNKYWIHCYDCIRVYYPENDIVIIDDNSCQQHLTTRELYKTRIIQSEYHKRGELLPYYYYAHNRFFDTAVILHDSAFINRYIDTNVDTYKIMWSFAHKWDKVENETKIIKVFEDKELMDFYNNKSLWYGCFGAMTIIKYDFLQQIHNKYNLDKLLDVILNRCDRCSFERVLACLLQKVHKDQKDNVLFGDIHKYCKWEGTKFNQKDQAKHLPIIKIWTGR